MKKILPLLLLTPTLANAECIPSPDCADMGYTETSCSGSFVRCPFDTSKLFCTPCDSSFQYDCIGENISGGVGNTCAGKYASCECSSSEYSFSKGNCICVEKSITDCIVGAIYYADGTCSNDYVSCQNPVGVVVKDNELVMSNVFSSTWNGYGTNISGITETTDSSVAKTDFNGKTNTLAIISTLTNSTASDTAATACISYTTEGTNAGDWYLPAVGELYSYVYRNYSKIYPTWVNKLVWNTHFAYYLLSSSERTDYTVWIIDSSVDAIGYRDKNATVSVTCFLVIN